jgi:hypothetical protein
MVADELGFRYGSEEEEKWALGFALPYLYGLRWSTMDAEVHIGGRDMELCRRRAAEHARAEEDGDEDDFVVFALICGEGVSDWARPWFGPLVVCCWAVVVGCGGGLLLGSFGWPGPGKCLLFFYLFSYFVFSI